MYNLCGAGRVRIQNINTCAGSVKRGGPRGGCGHDLEARAGLYCPSWYVIMFDIMSLSQVG